MAHPYVFPHTFHVFHVFHVSHVSHLFPPFLLSTPPLYSLLVLPVVLTFLKNSTRQDTNDYPHRLGHRAREHRSK